MSDILDKLKWLSTDMEDMEVPGDWLLPVNEAHSIIVRMREKHEQMATEITTLRAENARMWAENERMRKFIEWVAETFKGRSLENDARAALEKRT